MITNHKVRVTPQNIDLIRSGIYVPDQRRAVKIGDVVTTSETVGGGHITVFHNSGWAMKWDNVGPIGMPDTPPSKEGTWIDAMNFIMFDDGTISNLEGEIIRSR